MEKYFGNYLGLVVNTLDPENRGRVQVFIPNISPTLYKDWNEKSENIRFKTFESKAFTKEVVIRLLTHLPWAEAAVPFWGGSTGAPINQSTGTPTPQPTDQNFQYIVPPDGAGGGGVFQSHNGDRKGDLGATLASTIAKGLEGTGLNWVSYSGTGETSGQAENSQHLYGNASDGYFVDAKTGAKLDPTTSEEDKGRIAYALYRLTQAGINGVGYGPGYMGGTTNFHLDVGNFPNLRNWGRDYSSNTATSWVVQARSGVGVNASVASSGVPTEAYEDTRKVAVDGLARTDAEVTGKTISVGRGSVGFNGYSQNLLDAIKVWEAGADGSYFRSVAGKDGSIYTVGYGTEAPPGTTMNESQATQALIKDLNLRANIVNNALNSRGIVLTQSQKEALISYTFNRGPGGLNELLSNSGNTWESISSNLTRLWGTNQSASSGLINRRNWELEYANSNGTKGGAFNGTGSSSEFVTQTDGQNIIRTRTPDAYPSVEANRTGAPMGFTSIPYVGAKVWVFFIGGDAQRPVYFASVYEPNNIT